MSALLLRGALVRPQPAAIWRLSRNSHSQLSNISRTSRRPQSSTSSSSVSTSAPSPSNPTNNAPESIVQTQTKAQAPIASIPVPVPVPVPAAVAAAVAPSLPSFWERLGPLTRAGQAYARAQRSRPWVTQVVSALFIYLCADFGAQRLWSGSASENEPRRHDWARTARALVIGGSVAIPGYIWFRFLAHSFNYSSKILSIAVKVAVNQLTFTPIFSVYFFGSQALLSGDSPSEAWRRVCNTVPVSLLNSVKFWPAVTAFSFAFIPLEYRNVFGGLLNVGWQTYLSYLNGRAERLEAGIRHQKEEEPAVAVVASLKVVPQLQTAHAEPAAATL
ncbi:hypothetical protein F4777DRAFT_529247 [Nemania sp. FL0916]|nr:hypothetical protein F4777DRAFT_529247 [Nemania sp. FL0916]